MNNGKVLKNVGLVNELMIKCCTLTGYNTSVGLGHHIGACASTISQMDLFPQME